MIKFAKEKFYDNIDNLIDLNSNNPKQYWKIMKILMKGKSTTVIPPLLNLNDGSITDDDSEKVELLNNYFVSICDVDDSNAALPSFPKRSNSTISDINIIEDDVVDVIKILKVNKASGPDEISHRMLKLIEMPIARPLAILFNESLKCCKFPNLWKLAHVIPLYKKDDSSNVCNYRPISLLSCIGKNFERVV